MHYSKCIKDSYYLRLLLPLATSIATKYNVPTYKHIAIAVVERRILHRTVGKVHMHRQPIAGADIARPTHGMQSRHKVYLASGRRQIERVPAHLVRIGVLLFPASSAQEWCHTLEPLERLMYDRGPDAVQPGAGIFRARCGKRTARKLLRVQPVGTLLR